MKSKEFSISTAEWQVMRIVWTLNEVTSSDVIKQLADKNDWKETTIKTLLSRLVDKGFLTTRKNGRINHFTANISEQTAIDTASLNLFNDMCAMRVGSAVNEVIQRKALSKSDIEMLIETLKQKLATAPEKVDCDCLTSQKSA
ncbi:CopY/TcrY family copper transport repressor [Paucilactobacillus sp. N302-9]